MNKVNILKLNDTDYPDILRQIANPPKQIYWQGVSPSSWLSRPRVAIVGSRKVSGYGREVTTRLAADIASAGAVIISGLAYGVDAIAHEAALESDGLTVAVLPTSLDKIYPSAHAQLAKRIVDAGGTLISEYPPGSTPYKVNFTSRNRIVSGLADLVLITEAALRSGTASTARFALEQGRTVAAVPGNINSLNSQGANNLIKSGALAVTEAEDILFALNIRPAKRKEFTNFSGTVAEEKILQLIRSGVSDQEELALSGDLNGAEIASILISLELAGQIKPAGSGRFFPL